MSIPTIGQDPWGEDLNAVLVDLQGWFSMLSNDVAHLGERVQAIEDRAELVYVSSSWQFSNNPPPATGNEVRLDNTNLSLATVVDIRLQDTTSADRSLWIRALDVGSKLRITDWDDASASHQYDVTGPATIGATNGQIPVAWSTGNGVIPNAKINVGLLVALLS